MRKVKIDIRHTGFTLLVENPALKQKHLHPSQLQEVIERYARDHGMTVEQASKKRGAHKIPKWIVAGVSMGRGQAHALQLKEYPGSKYRIVGARIDYTPLEVKRDRAGESEAA